MSTLPAVTLHTTKTAPSETSQSQGRFPTNGGRRLREQEADDLTEVAVLSRPNTEIKSIDIEESQAFPEPRNDPQPDYWNHELRGNPPYRAILRNQDFSIRPLGANRVEFTFLCFMLTGVMVQNYANMAWRATGGKFTKSIFRFKIGGTW